MPDPLGQGVFALDDTVSLVSVSQFPFGKIDFAPERRKVSVVCADFAHDREKVLPMARRFQKNQKASRHCTHLYRGKWTRNVSGPLLQEVQHGRRELPVHEGERRQS
jgi:hypothetical protein